MEKILLSRLSDTCDINQPFKIGKMHYLFFNSLYHLIFIFNFISFFFKNDLANCKNLRSHKTYCRSVRQRCIRYMLIFRDTIMSKTKNFLSRSMFDGENMSKEGLKREIFPREYIGWTPHLVQKIPGRLLEEIMVSISSLSLSAPTVTSAESLQFYSLCQET